MRLPLKNDIMADLQKDGFPVAFEMLGAALDWYRSHFSYQHNLVAGTKRIDLNGREAGTVTEKEQRDAQKKIRDDQQKLDRNNATKTLAALHASNRIPDDQLKKLDAPPMKTKAAAPITAPELERLHQAFVAASNVLTTTDDPVLRSALATAALEVVIKEAHRVINEQAAPEV